MSSRKKASEDYQDESDNDEYNEEDEEMNDEEEYEDEDDEEDEEYDEEEEEEEEYDEEDEDDEEDDDDEQEEQGEDEEDDEDEEYEYGGDDDEDIVDGEDIVMDDPDDVDMHKQAVKVPDEERITNPIMTKYELTRVIGIRTAQLAKGANPLISNVQNKPPIRIAIDELLLKKTPFKIKRPMPYPAYEVWKISELEIEISQDDIDDLILAIK